MRITQKGDNIAIDQRDYLAKILKRFGMNNAKSANTPLPAGYMPMANQLPVRPDLRSRFQQVIGSLLYLMLGTRPDIAFAVTKMAQFAANLSQEHLDKALYICRYLVGTSNYALIFKGRSNEGLYAHTDSDWGSDPNTRRSQTGYFFKLADASICWQSHAQKTIALSSTEAEYMALSDCSRQAMWIKSLLRELGIPMKAFPIYGDNQGSIFISSNPVQERRTKHIDIRYHYVRELVESKEIEILFVDGNNNPADMFTKNLGHVKFLKFREHLGLEFY